MTGVNKMFNLKAEFEILTYFSEFYLNFAIIVYSCKGVGSKIFCRLHKTREGSIIYYETSSAIKIWNDLPQNVIDSNDIDQFKQKLAII